MGNDWRPGGAIPEGKAPEPLVYLGEEPQPHDIRKQVDKDQLEELKEKIERGEELSEEEFVICPTELQSLYLQKQGIETV